LNIVTEYTDGGNLEELIENHIKNKIFIKEDTILNYFSQLCLAINYIHQKNIILRNISAENVFLTEKGIVKFGNFYSGNLLKNTFDINNNSLFENSYYTAPELFVIKGNIPYSFKSDIWSLGVLLYRMTCLKFPFNANNAPALGLFIFNGKYKSIPDIYSNELKELIDKMLCVDVKKRPDIKEILKMDILKKYIKDDLMEEGEKHEGLNNNNNK